MTNEELVKSIKNAIEQISRDNSKRYLKNHFPELYSEMMNRTKFLDKYHIEENKNKWISIFERIYCLEHDLQERPMCKKCGINRVNGFIKTENRYRKGCSPKGQASDVECVKKSKSTRLEKYGNEKYNGIEKSRKTRLEKYDGK